MKEATPLSEIGFENRKPLPAKIRHPIGPAFAESNPVKKSASNIPPVSGRSHPGSKYFLHGALPLGDVFPGCISPKSLCPDTIVR
jgi:hypothetical protein